jgi:thiol-disulfide isomerase/thioredoxin
MKKEIICLLLVLSFWVSSTHGQGSITAKEPKPTAGVTNHYIYKPPTNLIIPAKIQALVVYQDKGQYFSKTVLLNKEGARYRFSFKAPDSTRVLLFNIIEPGKVIPEKISLVRERPLVVDNNNENGYIVYLHDKAGKRTVHEKLQLIGVLEHAGWYGLAMKQKPDDFFIKMYETSYALHAHLKKEDSYLDYLLYKYGEDSAATRAKLLDYANELLKEENNESKWIAAQRIYRNLKMTAEWELLDKKILTAFPNGISAKDVYWRDFNSDTTEKSILALMDAYQKRFNDNTPETRDRFYNSIIHLSSSKKEWTTAFKYGELVKEKIRAAGAYDYYAWRMSGKQTDNPGTDLENAKMLSARSIAISTALFADTGKLDEDTKNDIKESHYRFYDTYALILFKLGQYDSAFYYQDLVSKQGKELNAGGMERYAAYAGKVKGAAFIRPYLESKLSSGVKSPAMLKQLQSIYRDLNLPEDEFNRVQERSLLLVRQKNEAAIKAKYGTLKAIDFSLKNLNGETVSLSGLKNKIVVLDFWATWCSPCKASFPAMQALVRKYDNDKDIVFLFIDTWEEMSQKHTATVAQYIQNSKYDFNVLFDEKSLVSKNYKIGGLPRKIVIGKNGNLMYTGQQSGSLVLTGDEAINEMIAIIEEAKK